MGKCSHSISAPKGSLRRPKTRSTCSGSSGGRPPGVFGPGLPSGLIRSSKERLAKGDGAPPPPHLEERDAPERRRCGGLSMFCDSVRMDRFLLRSEADAARDGDVGPTGDVGPLVVPPPVAVCFIEGSLIVTWLAVRCKFGVEATSLASRRGGSETCPDLAVLTLVLSTSVRHTAVSDGERWSSFCDLGKLGKTFLAGSLRACCLRDSKLALLLIGGSFRSTYAHGCGRSMAIAEPWMLAKTERSRRKTGRRGSFGDCDGAEGEEEGAMAKPAS
mmetsp:Transcript_7434/g.16389  ORF Transcript_7434/g.16389 Transcript_7434/m.16389 type:complete len:274 (-) Transcript_7434:46-867(-)